MAQEIKFRPLTHDEVECRVGTQRLTGTNPYCTLLLYKDARVDQRLLDEVVGPMNWQRSHQVIDGNLYCTVSIYDESKGQWVSKQDVGTESNTEKEKGQSSDSFKRACFLWGIGRALYTAPDIFINLSKDEIEDVKVNGKDTQRLKTRFKVTHLATEKGKITALTIVDNHGKIRFPKQSLANAVAATNAAVATPKKTPTPPTVEEAAADFLMCLNKDDMAEVWRKHKHYQQQQVFLDAMYNCKARLGL